MTERERWIVYPLLFLALGTSLRGKLGLAEDEIITKNLKVIDSQDKAVVVINKDGVVVGKKMIVGELVSEKPTSHRELVCDNLVVRNQALIKQQIATEIILIDPTNPQRKLAVLSKDAKSGGAALSLNNEAGATMIGMGSTGKVGRIELWQQPASIPYLRQAINADGKPGVWENYPLPVPKQKAEAQKKKADADKANKKADDAKQKNDPDEVDPSKKEKDD